MRRHALLLVLLPCALTAQEVDRDAICKSLSDDLVKELSTEPHSKDYRLYRVASYYSAKLDSCIHLEEKLIGLPEVMVRDMTRSVITDRAGSYPPLLLHCDAYGVDEVEIDAVRELRGEVQDVPFEQWLTDGLGGPPRAVMSPDIRYTRADCEAALVRWIGRWQ